MARTYRGKQNPNFMTKRNINAHRRFSMLNHGIWPSQLKNGYTCCDKKITANDPNDIKLLKQKIKNEKEEQ